MVKCTHKPMFVRFSGIICYMFVLAHPGGIFVVNVAGPFPCQNTVKYGFSLSAFNAITTFLGHTVASCTHTRELGIVKS